MIRERIGQAAVRTYPPAVRQTRGLEMLGMMLDAAEQSNGALLRETGSLVRGGLRERRAITARAGTRRLLADSCCQAALIWLTLWIISAANTEVIAGPSRQLIVQQVILASMLGCALIGFERIAAIGALAAMAVYLPVGLYTQQLPPATVLVPIACLLVMLRAPRKRPRDPRRLLWVLPVSVLAAICAYAHVSLPEALAVISAAGLLRLFHDPRLAIACSLVWIAVLAHAGRPGPPGLGVLAILAAMAAGLILAVLRISKHDARGV